MAACSPCSLRGKQKGVDIRIRPSLIKMNQRYKAFRQKQASAFSPVQEIDVYIENTFYFDNHISYLINIMFLQEDIQEPEIIEPEIAAAIMHTEQQGVSFTKSPEKMCEFLFPCEPGEEDEPSIMVQTIDSKTAYLNENVLIVNLVYIYTYYSVKISFQSVTLGNFKWS